ncbi:glycosyltransferase family 4 protein [Sphingomonadaceae bacterium OTU29MARTA1]|nr:glycosyltransferase family 4 protein [Sphingomonadaceae bacterium OTU29MARTA1]
MKILLTTDAVGGVWQYTTELAQALSARGVECVVAVLGPAPDEDQRIALVSSVLPRKRESRAKQDVARNSGFLRSQEHGVPITLIETGLPLDWTCADAAPVLAAGKAIATLAKDHAADLIHYNMPTLAAVGTPPVPSIAVAHGCVSTWWEAAKGTPLGQDYRWHRALTADGLRAVDRVVAPSAAYATIVERHYRLETPVLAIHNGRTLAGAYDPAAPMADIALIVGRLWDGVKNAALLDKAAARLPIPFLAAGASKGPHGETIRLDHLRELGHLSGEQIAAHLAKRPIFVSAASFEPFGLAVLEAAQAGCALVLADIPTFRELWDGAASFVPLDGGWCEAIEALVHDTPRRAALGEAARSRAARYTPDATADRMLALYRDVIASHPPARKAAA